MSTRELPRELLDMLLTTEEVAAVLKCSTRAAKELIKDGTIPSVKIGAFRRVPMDEFRAYLDGLVQRRSAA